MYYRVECFKDGTFQKLYILDSLEVANTARIKWEEKGKGFTTRMFHCNKQGNNYSGREVKNYDER